MSKNPVVDGLGQNDQSSELAAAVATKSRARYLRIPKIFRFSGLRKRISKWPWTGNLSDHPPDGWGLIEPEDLTGDG